MSLYAISDLHLSGAASKPMDIFGEEWTDHKRKIKESWNEKVKPEDTVIIAGDVSWASTLSEADGDLRFIDCLCGNKVIVKGNHDYWWQSLKKNRESFPGLNFIQNDFFACGEYAVCGSRGWLCQSDAFFTPSDEKIYRRELIRLEASFSAAKKAGYGKYICVTHFPPMNSMKESSGFIDIIERYGAEYAIFGHLHGAVSSEWVSVKIGKCKYVLTSCDFLGFEVMLVTEC